MRSRRTTLQFYGTQTSAKMSVALIQFQRKGAGFKSLLWRFSIKEVLLYQLLLVSKQLKCDSTLSRDCGRENNSFSSDICLKIIITSQASIRTLFTLE